MTLIGIVGTVDEKNKKIEASISESKYQVKRFSKQMLKEESLANVDGIILIEGANVDFKVICECLVYIKSNTQILVWIIADQTENQARHLYLELGASGILSEKDASWFLAVKNTINKQDNHSQRDLSNQLVLNEANQSVFVDGEREELLTRQEYKIMKLLFAQANQTVTYEKLYYSLWNSDFTEGANYRVANIIFNLREKIEKKESGIQFIQTIRSKGYRLKM